MPRGRVPPRAPGGSWPAGFLFATIAQRPAGTEEEAAPEAGPPRGERPPMTTTQQAPRPGQAGTGRPRRSPVGAEPVAGGGTHFRVWAPRRRRVEVVLEPGGG